MSSPKNQSQNAKIPPITKASLGSMQAKRWRKDTGIKDTELLEKNLTIEEIRDRAIRAEHDRDQSFRDNFECMAVFTLWFAWFILMVVSGVWALHLITAPGSLLHWLSDEQLSKLHNVVTGGIIATFGANHLKKRLS